MGAGRAEAHRGRFATPRSRHRPLRQTAGFRLGGTGLRRRAIRARSDGRHGRGRPDRRAAQRIGLEQAAHLDEDESEALCRFAAGARRCASASRISKAFRRPNLPDSVQAELRPYQKDGFDFLCHLAQIKLGGILADDMGLGKTLQTLTWLAWLKERNQRKIPSRRS